MEYRRLGNSGLKVSPICLGAMMFGERTDAIEAGRIVESARAAGINFIDTADQYAKGESERVTGKLIANDREQWVLATKVGNPMGKGPNETGLSRAWLMRAIAGAPKNITVSLEHGRWFMAVQTEREAPEPTHPRPTAAVGVDLGVEHLAALSTGELRERLAPLTAAQKRLRRYQRAVARKRRKSKNRAKATQRLARIHARCAAIRANMAHQLSHELARDYALIALEDLQVKAMSASARGTAAAPGQRVRQKAGLNRAILDAGWGRLRRLLEYKAAERGGQVHAVPPAYTSQACNACGHVAAENRPERSIFSCAACGHAEHADVNAAKNILAAALAACGAHLAAPIQLPADSGKVTPLERDPSNRAATSRAVRRSAGEPAEGLLHVSP